MSQPSLPQTENWINWDVGRKSALLAQKMKHAPLAFKMLLQKPYRSRNEQYDPHRNAGINYFFRINYSVIAELVFNFPEKPKPSMPVHKNPKMFIPMER